MLTQRNLSKQLLKCWELPHKFSILMKILLLSASLALLVDSPCMPVLVFEDRTVMMNPTPAEFSEKMHSLFALPQARQVLNPPLISLLSLWLALLAGWGVFALGIVLGNGLSSQISSIVLFTVVFTIVDSTLLGLLPAIRRFTSRLKRLRLWDTMKTVVTLAYAICLGVAMGVRVSSMFLPLFIGLTATCLLLFALVRIMYSMWENHQAGLSRWQV